MRAKRVEDLMSRDVVTLHRNDKLSVADDLMKQERIRHLAILDESEKLCGIISQRDLFRGALVRALGFGSHAENRMLERLAIKEAMTEDPLTVAPDATLEEAAQTMIDRKIGALPILQDDKLVGILTEGDFVRLALPTP